MSKNQKIEKENIYIEYSILLCLTIIGFVALTIYGYREWYHYLMGILFGFVFWHSLRKILNARKM